jgi:hypothetical protein
MDGYVAVDAKACRYMLLTTRLYLADRSTATRERALSDFSPVCYQQIIGALWNPMINYRVHSTCYLTLT